MSASIAWPAKETSMKPLAHASQGGFALACRPAWDAVASGFSAFWLPVGLDKRVNAHEIGALEVRHPARGHHCATGPNSHRGIGASGGRVVKATPRRLNRCLLVRWEGV